MHITPTTELSATLKPRNTLFRSLIASLAARRAAARQRRRDARILAHLNEKGLADIGLNRHGDCYRRF